MNKVSDFINRQDAVDAMIMLGIKRAVPILVALPSAESERTAKVEKITLKEDVTIGAGTFKKGTTVLSKCGACGGYVRPSDIYCVNCGARLEWE